MGAASNFTVIAAVLIFMFFIYLRVIAILYDFGSPEDILRRVREGLKIGFFDMFFVQI